MIHKLHNIKNVVYGDPQPKIVLKCLKILVNIHLLFTHLAVVIAVFFLCVIFKRFAFSCGKKEWPAGKRENYRFRHCNFAT